MRTSTTDNHAVAQAVHDIGSALWLGGTVMGVAGVNQAGKDLTQGIDRIRVAGSAWRRFGPLQWLGIGATLLAGLQLTRSSGRRLALQKGYASVGTAKAGAAVLGAAATAYSAYCGMQIGKLAEEARQRGDQIDVKNAIAPGAHTPIEIARWQRRQRLIQYVVPALAGANVILGSYLVQSYRSVSTAKGILRRFLPD